MKHLFGAIPAQSFETQYNDIYRVNVWMVDNLLYLPF